MSLKTIYDQKQGVKMYTGTLQIFIYNYEIFLTE